MKNQETTKFAFQREGFIQIITKHGNIDSFLAIGRAQLNNQRFYPDGIIENQVKDDNSGKWTIIDEITTYAEISQKIAENLIRVSQIEKKNNEEKAIATAIANEKRNKAIAEKMQELYAMPKGWYVIEFSAMVSLVKGNDGWRDYTWKCLANNGVEAFEMARRSFNEKMPRNVSFVYTFCEITQANIDYVGVWTDELESQYN